MLSFGRNSEFRTFITKEISGYLDQNPAVSRLEPQLGNRGEIPVKCGPGWGQTPSGLHGEAPVGNINGESPINLCGAELSEVERVCESDSQRCLQFCRYF